MTNKPVDHEKTKTISFKRVAMAWAGQPHLRKGAQKQRLVQYAG